MKRQGRIEFWDEARGFGFILSEQTKFFFHIRDAQLPGGAPQVGMQVEFVDIVVGGKGPRAMSVRAAPGRTAPAANRPSTPARGRWDAPSSREPRVMRRESTSQPNGAWPMLVLIWLAAWLWGVGTGRIPVALLWALPVLNILTFWIYWMDKDAARKRRWRVQERTLHLLALAGGWPAAVLAQRVLRHKSVKQAFQNVFFATVAIHGIALALWLSGWRFGGL